ncbi:MAG: ABC transporter substrate-binding protein [Candidatus Abyssubacteria bacterium]
MKSRLVTLAGALLLALCAGCAEKEPGKVTVSFLDTEDKSGAWAEIIANFEERNPDIAINFIEGPASTNTRESQYATSLMAQDPMYDLIYMDVVWVAKFAAAGWIVPLDDRFPLEEREKYLPGDIKAGVYDGHIWRIPLRSDGGMLYYRKDLLMEANLAPPETFDELVELSKKLQTEEVRGLVFQGKQYEGLTCVFLEVLRGFGGDLLSPEGQPVINSPEGLSAMTWMRDIIFEHKIVPEAVRTYEENEALATFLSGKSVFMRNWPYAWKVTQEEGSPLVGKVGITTMTHAPREDPSATLGGWGFALSSYSRHKDAAWKFARHCASAESVKIFAKRQGGAPSLKSLYEDPELLALNPHYPELYEVLLHAEPRPVHPQYAEISDSVQRHVSAVITGLEMPEQAVQAIDTDIRRILERRRW